MDKTTRTKPIYGDLFNLGALVLIVFVFFIFNYSFRTALLVGFVAAVLTFPLYDWFQNRIKKRFPRRASELSSIITLLIVSLILLILINTITAQLVSEIPGFIDDVIDFTRGLANNEGVMSLAQSAGVSQDTLRETLGNFPGSLQANGNNTNTWLTSILNQENIQQALNVGQQIFTTLFSQLTYLIIFFLAWYNALVFGQSWIQTILTVLPFTGDESKAIKRDLKIGIRNVIYANLLSGLIHSVAVFIIMILFGLPNVFIISLLVFFIGFLPASPSELGYVIPISMIFMTNPLAAIILMFVAEGIIIWANYVFLPRIILSGNEGNPLFVITSVLAGLSIFGLMGFIIGPVIMIFTNTLGQIVLRRINGQPLQDIVADKSMSTKGFW